jgi:hypothetical protein
MSLEAFIEDPMYNATVDQEIRNRIKLAVYAYSYEFLNESVVCDGDFDALALKIDLSVNTRRPDLDLWFRKQFQPDTGQWIHSHPELNKIAELYKKYYAKATS